MHRETKATLIPGAVKRAVRKRDGGRCVICGRAGDPHCHVVRRSAGGMGVEQNIVTLCPRCHYAFDEGLWIKDLEPLGMHSRKEVRDFLYSYMEHCYPGWSPESVTYRKWSNTYAE